MKTQKQTNKEVNLIPLKKKKSFFFLIFTWLTDNIRLSDSKQDSKWIPRPRALERKTVMAEKERRRSRKMGMKKWRKRQKVRWTLQSWATFPNSPLPPSVWLVLHSGESAQKAQRAACFPGLGFFYKANKEVYNFVEQKITIEEGIDSYSGMIWPAVSSTSCSVHDVCMSGVYLHCLFHKIKSTLDLLPGSGSLSLPGHPSRTRQFCGQGGPGDWGRNWSCVCRGSAPR